MQITLKNIRLVAAAAAAAALLTAAQPDMPAFAQTPTTTSAALPEAAIRSLQEALNKLGIATKTDGVLNDETRAAIRKYQSQHHLAVTGEPDKATLDKLGVTARQSATPLGQAVQAQPGATTGAANPTAGPQMMPGGMMQGGMMSCPMMQGQAAGPSGMMQGGMMQPGQRPQSGTADREMMQNMMQMMQMMQGMMQMMHAQMQRQQTPSAATAPMQPGQMQPDQMKPGQMPQAPR